ncbi:maltase 2-like isoform X2 [Chironomus tepperi]|uniref:maltase 2-like isoform X2 n=1 Tax=Chironomus tepperi TaxID=113505 RepID=UPI00391F23B1
MRILFLSVFLYWNLLTACAAKDEAKDWWQTTVFYQIYPRSFADSNGDGIGDLKGITSRLSHLKEAGVGATWLSPIFKSPMVDFGYDISDYESIQPEYGTMEDFDELIAKANELGIKMILDFVPNHSSDKHEWFIKSEAGDPEYKDFYVWSDGKPNPNGGRNLEPNNWVSVFYGSAWEWSDKRKQYYLHQFTKQQPDLNYRNPKVMERMTDVLRFWLKKGVAGFRVDAINHLFEVPDLVDEPVNIFDKDPKSYGHLWHFNTVDLMEVYDVIYAWRDVLDDFKKTYGGDTRIMMTEAYANMTFTMRYYESDDGTRKGSHIPFNFLMISDLNADSSARDFAHTVSKWMNYMPVGFTANWVLGNHDNSRVASRYGVERIDALNAMLLTLPGAGVTYNGEEIGMVDNKNISWKDTQDPAACNTNPDVYMKFSRDPERTPFQWDATKNAGFSTADKTWLPVHPNYFDLNVKAQMEAEKSHFKFYKRLIELRKHKTFQDGTIKVQALHRNVFAYVRELKDEDTFVVVINLGKNVEHISLSPFKTLRNKLKVVAAAPSSEYHEGDEVETVKLTLGKNEALILIEPAHCTSLSTKCDSPVVLMMLVLIAWLFAH